MTDQDILELARKRFRLVQDAEANQREDEKDDLRFQVPELMWDEDAKRNRLGDSVAGVPIPPRPILSVPKLDQPIQLIQNQQRAANLGIQIHGISAGADDDTAEVLQGIVRMVERDSRADLARSWAFDRAVKCGRGAYRINTKYCDDPGQHPFDQDIVVERILHQESVYFDPGAKEPDWSDGRWAFVTSWMPIDDFRAEFPDAEVPTGEEMSWENDQEEVPQWVRMGDEQDSVASVLVAEYWYMDSDTEEIFLLPEGDIATREQAKAYFGGKIPKEVRRRERSKDSVWFCKITGQEVLSTQQWNGRYIPLIPVIGKELIPFDDRRRWIGVIRPAKDSQRLYNYAASGAVEMAALEPRAPWVMAEGQAEGYEDEWQQSNTRNLPMLRYKVTNVAGHLVPPPQRVPVDVGRLGPNMALLQEADQFIQSSTATFDPSLGKLPQKDRSGRAILALQNQSDAGNSGYLTNLAEISMTYEGKVFLDLVPRIYDRPGRVVRILNPEDDSDTVILNEPFVTHPETGEAKAISEMKDEGLAPPQGLKMQEYNLAEGVYGVTVSIGKSHQTMTEQAADEIGQLLQAAPQLMPLLAPIYFKHRKLPGADEIVEIMKKVREKQFPGLEDDEEGGPTAEQLQGQMGQMQQQMQAMQQALQQAQQELELDTAKQQATLAKTQMEVESKERIASQNNQTKLMIEEMDEKFRQLQGAIERGFKVQSQSTVGRQKAGEMLLGSALTPEPAVAMPAPAPSAKMPLEGEE